MNKLIGKQSTRENFIKNVSATNGKSFDSTNIVASTTAAIKSVIICTNSSLFKEVKMSDDRIL